MSDKCFKSRFVCVAGIIFLICNILPELSRHIFGLFIRSSRDTTSHIKPSPSGCTALSLWWGLLKGFLIRRCLSTKPGSTRCSDQTDHHTSPFSLWVRSSVLVLTPLSRCGLSGCKGNHSHNSDYYPVFLYSAGCSSQVTQWRRNKGRDL